ncbi:MAG: methyltransferase domain-containing protein [Opitutus sp.]
MPSWDSNQYLRFVAERTRPAEDLAARISVQSPSRVIDLGCGPGNSTAVVALRWPAAELTGLDSSAAMVESSRRSSSSITWSVGDIATWSTTTPYDVIFSNAALQWVPDHASLLPRLMKCVVPGGALAFQVPANFDAPGHQLIRSISSSDRWRHQFRSAVREWHVEEPSFYYDSLATCSRTVDLWTTEYFHVMPGPDAIVEWYRGTGLRPWLDALPDEVARTRFCDDYLDEITRAFPPQNDGKVLFPFRRLFVIAYR